MIVTRVASTPLAVPLREPFHWSSGAQLGANVVLWTVETDEGVTGHGESVAEHPAAVEAYGSLIAEWFVGRSPGDVEAVLRALWREGRWRFTPRWTNQVLSGIETACWDALGKALGVPASTFLGGRVRDEVDVIAFPQGATPAALAADAAARAAEGYRVVYVKVGRGDDEATVAAVREAIGPDTLLRIDPNEAWDAATAIARLRRLEAYGLDWVEQPVPAGDLKGLARVRAATGVRVAADQAVHTRDELTQLVAADAADVVVLGHHECGGLWRLRQLAALAEAHGLTLNRHAWLESELSLRAALQVMAAVPNLTLGNQVMHQLLAESLVDAPLATAGGRLQVPDAPGLGLALDHDVIARAHERYRRRGPYPALDRSLRGGR